jgi:hypothetical protein
VYHFAFRIGLGDRQEIAQTKSRHAVKRDGLLVRQVAVIDLNRPNGSGLPRRDAAKAGEPPLPL